MTPAATFMFGPYRFIPSRQLLLDGDKVVRVGCRALDLLTCFVQCPGEVVTKRQLLEEAWPSTTVVEGNLKVHIAALRRALNDDADDARYIATVFGRGYRFIATVETGEAPPTGARIAPEIGEDALAAAASAPDRFEEALALVTRTMRSRVIDVPMDPERDPDRRSSRRLLFIELTPLDEAATDDLFVEGLRAISATR